MQQKDQFIITPIKIRIEQIHKHNILINCTKFYIYRQNRNLKIQDITISILDGSNKVHSHWSAPVAAVTNSFRCAINHPD